MFELKTALLQINTNSAYQFSLNILTRILHKLIILNTPRKNLKARQTISEAAFRPKNEFRIFKKESKTVFICLIGLLEGFKLNK